MTDYKASKRLVGTSSERTALNLASPPQTSWKELDRVTLTSSGDSMDTGTFTTKDNIMLLIDAENDGQVEPNLRIGNSTIDSGNNYARRSSYNGGADSTATSNSYFAQAWNSALTNNFIVGDFVNISSKEKLGMFHGITQNTAGAGNAPTRAEVVGKWANTSAQANRVEVINTDTGSFASGSEVVVLGYDNDEADSGTNFWQELANIELSSAGDTLDTSTITAKKYLWIQVFIPEGAGHHGYIYFNNDTGANYARRGSINGGSDITTAPDNEINWSHDTNSAKYLNMFVMNKSDKEKLCIAEYMDYGSSGAGNAPNRIEWVYKWANTSAQITSVKLYNNQASSNDFPIGTKLEVWGAN